MNDLRSSVDARLVNADVDAASVSVTALESALLKADGLMTVNASGGSMLGKGTVWAGGGQIATNVVLAEANAAIVASDVTTTGDLLVSAKNTSGIDATVLSSVTSTDTSVGITLAFNALGWKASNVLFNTIDAILGDPLISGALGGEQPAEAVASVVNSKLHVGGNATVLADNDAALNATLSNAATSNASALMGATGAGVGFMIASNKVSAGAKAFISSEGAQVTSDSAPQVVDAKPGTLVTLHEGFGTATATAADAAGSQQITLTPGAIPNVTVGAGYGTPDVTATGSATQPVTGTPGTNVQLGAGWGNPTTWRTPAKPPRMRRSRRVSPAIKGTLVELAPTYGLSGRWRDQVRYRHPCSRATPWWSPRATRSVGSPARCTPTPAPPRRP